jgi:hypothetical protein
MPATVRHSTEKRCQQPLLRIGAPQLEIVYGQLCSQAELDGFDIGGGRLGLLTCGSNRPPDAAPQVQLVGEVEGEEKVPRLADVRIR